MKIQIALDTLSISECFKLVDACVEDVDVLEAGTPLIIEEGVAAVRALKRRYPGKLVLADVKIMDAGEYEAAKCFAAGADIVTVLGVSHDETIIGCVRAAQQYGGKIMVDMICVNDLAKRSRELEKIGVDYLCVHTAFDVQAVGVNSLADLAIIEANTEHVKCCVAGGIKIETLKEVVKSNAEIVVVGGAICNAEKPNLVAKQMRDIIKEAKG